MQALVQTEIGRHKLFVLEKDDIHPAPHQVKVKVHYTAICGTDIHTYEGKYKVAAPITLGHEFAGEIVEVGSAVTEFSVGDRVTAETTYDICGQCPQCQTKQYNLCSLRQGIGTQKDGTFAEYLLIRKESVHKLPDNVDYLAASMTEAVACAHHIVGKSSIGPGSLAVIMGPGPIGLLVAQVAKYRGATVVITGLTRDKIRLDTARELGIDHILDIESADVQQVVLALTAGQGADIVFECSGADVSFNLGIDILKKQGEYIQAGVFLRENIPADLNKVINKEIKIMGSRSQNPSDWEPSLQLMSSGAVETTKLISHQFSLQEWEKAYLAIKSGKAIKVVLKPGGASAKEE